MPARTILCLLSLTSLVVCGCREDPEKQELRSRVRRVLAGYRDRADGTPVEKKQELMRIGDAAVPVLEEVLRKERDFKLRFNAGYALIDLGTEDSFQVLVKAIEGKTRMDRGLACLMLTGFAERNGWTPERVQRFPGATPALQGYVDDEDQAYRVIMVARQLRLSHALPKLREYVRNENHNYALRASRAIFAISGERVAMSARHEPHFPSTSIAEGMMRLRWTRPLVVGVPYELHLTRLADGSPALASMHYDRKLNKTDVRWLSEAGEELLAFSRKGLLAALTLTARREGPDSGIFTALAALNPRAKPQVLVAFDMSGDEVWRVDAPAGGYFLSKALYRESEQESDSILLSYEIENSGFLCVSMDGELIWRKSTDFYAENLRTDLSCPGWFGAMCQWAVRLFKDRGIDVNPSLLEWEDARDVVVFSGADLGTRCAAIRWPTDDSTCRMIMRDESMTELWSCEIGESCRHLAVLAGPEQATPVVLALGMTGTLYAVDATGCLRWMGPLFKTDALEFDDAGLDVLPATEGRPALILAYCDKEIALWEVIGDRR